LAFELRLQCNQYSQNLGGLLLIEIRSQIPTEKIALTLRRGVRLRNTDSRSRNLTSNCTDIAT
jgi:hypothetical protein